MVNINIIMAYDKCGGIGRDGAMPWPNLTDDMVMFAKHTTSWSYPDERPAVVMGRKTWESLPKRHRPLKGRVNIVLSNTLSSTDECHVVSSYTAAIDLAASMSASVWVIGGGSVVDVAMDHVGVDSYGPKSFYATELDTVYPDCDTGVDLSKVYTKFSLASIYGHYEESGIIYRTIRLNAI
jgi:dihydrofolate reductase/thymidylate synthase